MSKKLLKKIILVSASAVAIFILGTIAYVRVTQLDNLFTEQEVPQAPVIIILGASLKTDGTPSDALEDRLIRGAELFIDQKAPKILVTGDDGQNHSDEVSVMKQYLIDKGIPEAAIQVDGHGYRTYESCKRAKQEFGYNQAILVTQKFHLVRALYLCNSLGVESNGVTSDLRHYKSITQLTIRDWLASFKAWIDLNIWKPVPPVKY
ncbi:YdcF family protein [Patescibacteria group bacterium]|nr:YdcF family protein [Patescibacteria group bacterium]